MYKVLFAEDEVLVRLGLKNSIQWERFHMTVVADVDNGITALEKFRELKPDLVITDIKMGGMDGCELIQHIREEDKECGIIILSCLDDFKILQNMISYNILDYLLKATMTMEEIYKVLGGAQKYLDRVKHKVEEKFFLMPKPEEALTQYIVRKKIDWEQMLEVFAYHKKELPQILKTMILFEIDKRDRDKISELGILFIKDMICTSLKDGFLFLIGPDKFGYLLPEELANEEENVEAVVFMVRGILNVVLKFCIYKMEQAEWCSLPIEYEKCVELSRSFEGGMRTKTADINIRKAIEYVQNNYTKQLTLSEVAEKTNLSPNYFSAIFKRKMKISFVSYLTCLRVEKAKELLSSSSEYLYVIAEKAGFQNFEHFSRIFKQTTGKSPTNWKKEEEQKEEEERRRR